MGASDGCDISWHGREFAKRITVGLRTGACSRGRRAAGRSKVIAVALPPEQAIEVFTPEGERKWSEGWDPVYPRPERTAGPGAAFVTGHDSHTTTWTMVDHTAGCVRYARMTPGVAAGTVTVALEADGAGGSRAQVTYDLTSLSADGDARLADFDRAHDADVAEWETAIAEALASGA